MITGSDPLKELNLTGDHYRWKLSNLDETGEDSTIRARPNALVLFNPVADNDPGGYGYERSATGAKKYRPCTTSKRSSTLEPLNKN